MATELHDHIAREVRAEMARQGVSQADLADRLQTGQAHISRKLVGRLEFTTRDLQRIADALGVPVTQFLVTREPAGGAA